MIIWKKMLEPKNWFVMLIEVLLYFCFYVFIIDYICFAIVNAKKGNPKHIVIVTVIFTLGIIGSIFRDEEVSHATSDVIQSAEADYNYNSERGIVTGDYSGFGSWAVMTANYGGQAANCQEKGVGISLVEQIENFFENISQNNRPEFYHIKQQNPQLGFLVSNPVWAENMTFPNACKADVEFDNISNDTVMGYYDGEPYTVDDSYCRITYTVSEQGGKFRANVINMFCTPTYGYR